MSAVDFLANARAGWGEEPPDWVVQLAAACMRTSATEVAKQLDYTVAVVTSVVRNTYKGSLPKVEAKVRGAFMGETLECPVLGEIGRDQCEVEQAKGFTGTSALRAMLYRACRAGCPNSRLKGGGNV